MATRHRNAKHLDKFENFRALLGLACLLMGRGATCRCRHLGAPAVIGLTRLYCNQGERFLLVDVASEDASKRAEELANDGWEIEAEIPI